MRPAVFLDRDDTLIENRLVTASTPYPGDLIDPALVRLMPGVAEGCRRLSAAGYALVVVSNQGCVARGLCTVERVDLVNRRMTDLLSAQGATVDAVYFCPHHPKGTVAPFAAEHPWRKPAPGMLLAASKDLGLDMSRSWMIGDASRDIDAALAAGIAKERAILVGEGGLPTFELAVERVLHRG